MLPSSLCSEFFCLPCYLQLDEEDFKEEQSFVARLIQMMHSDDPEEMLKVILSFVLQIDICSDFMFSMAVELLFPVTDPVHHPS